MCKSRCTIIIVHRISHNNRSYRLGVRPAQYHDKFIRVNSTTKSILLIGNVMYTVKTSFAN